MAKCRFPNGILSEKRFICNNAGNEKCHPECQHQKPHKKHLKGCECGGCGPEECLVITYCCSTNADVKCVEHEA